MSKAIEELLAPALAEVERRKQAIDTEIEQKKIELREIESEKNKMLIEKGQSLSDQYKVKFDELNQREKIINERELTLNKREKDLSIIDSKIVELKKSSDDFELVKKSVEKIRIDSLERNKLAELKIAEYEGKLKELEELKKG